MTECGNKRHACSYTLTVWYLALPLMIWLFGWTQPWVSIPLIGLLMWVLVSFSTHPIPALETPAPGRYGIAVGLLLCAVLVFFIGFDGHMMQTMDLRARNAVYNDLIQRPWPVTYPDGRYLLYPTHFWLIPSLCARLVPPTLAIQIWSFTGFALLFWNLHTRLGLKKALFIMCCLPVMASLTVFCDDFVNVALHVDAIYAYAFSHPTATIDLSNTFHYFITTTLCLSVMTGKETPWRHFVVMSFLLACLHPMCAAALLPFVLWRWYQEAEASRQRLYQALLIKEIGIGAVLVLVSMLYYGSGDSNGFQLVFDVMNGPGRTPWGVFVYITAVLLNMLPLVLVWKITKYTPLLCIAGMLPIIQLCSFGCDNGINEWSFKSVCACYFLLIYALATHWEKPHIKQLTWLILAFSALPVLRILHTEKNFPEVLYDGFAYKASNIRTEYKGSMHTGDPVNYRQLTGPAQRNRLLFK